MADRDLGVPENAAGGWFVDSSCIDCDTCRWMAPEIFADAGSHSYVARQPATPDEAARAARALVACPTASIGTDAREFLAAARKAFPLPIDGPVHHNGYHDEASFGATSYFVRRADGNVLVDVPRFSKALVDNIEAMGGLAWIFLTHRDDVGSHRKWARHFGAKRIIHENDREEDTQDVEVVLDGDEPRELLRGGVVIPTPGHSPGSACLLIDGRWLFSGDHIAGHHAAGRLTAFRNFSDDWPRTRASVGLLKRFTFEWVLPGHGRIHQAPPAEMQKALDALLAWMRTV